MKNSGVSLFKPFQGVEGELILSTVSNLHN